MQSTSEAKDPNNHYVSNKDFLQALKEYKVLRDVAIKDNKPIPRIPNYIGLCIQKIANNVSFKHQYKNYPFREEMISDGIENCIRYLHNFDPDKYSNPFAYFTTIIIYAFWRRIEKEKNHLMIKSRLIQDIDLEAFDTQEFDKDEDFKCMMKEFLQTHNEPVYEDKPRKARKKKEATLDEFMDDFNPDDMPEITLEDIVDE